MIPKTKGGIATAFRNITTWMIVLTVSVLFSYREIQKRKENYTDLHHKVHELEGRVDKLERR